MSYAPYELKPLQRHGLDERVFKSPRGTLRTFAFPGCAVRRVFLHGIGLDSSAWSPLLQAAREAETDTAGWVFVDLPGHGGSPAIDNEVNLTRVGALVMEAVMESWGGLPRKIVGHSMGGFLALDMARQSGSFSDLVVFNGNYAGIVDCVNDPLVAIRRNLTTSMLYHGMRVGSALSTALGDFVPSTIKRHLVRTGLHPVAANANELPVSLIDEIASGLDWRVFRDAESTGVNYNYREAWAQISANATLVFGSEDHLVGDYDRQVAAEVMPAARIELMPVSGHFTPIEQPAESLKFLS